MPNSPVYYPQGPVDECDCDLATLPSRQDHGIDRQPARSKILQTADETINGPRHDEYGSAQESFDRIAKLWSLILGHEVTAEQVSLCMIQLKLARLIHSPDHADSWVDICGYAALGGEIAEIRERFI